MPHKHYAGVGRGVGLLALAVCVYGRAGTAAADNRQTIVAPVILASNSTWTVDVGNAIEVQGGIGGGSVTLTKCGGGALYFTTTSNSFHGAILMRAGSLTSSVGGAIPGDLIVGGNTGAAAYAESVSNGLSATAAVTVKTNGAFAPASGETFGSLNLEAGGVATVAAATAGTLQFKGGTVAGGALRLVGSQAVTTCSNGQTAILSADLVFAASGGTTVDVARGTSTVDLDVGGAWTGGSAGAALWKTDAGVLRLNHAAGSRYTASATYLDGGTTLVCNTTGSGLGGNPVWVRNGATLGGTGMIGGVGGWTGANVNVSSTFTNAPSTLAPGTVDATSGQHIAGTLTVGGAAQTNTVTFGAGGQMLLAFGADGSHDQLAVQGGLDLSAGSNTLAFAMPGAGVPAGAYTLATFTSLTGRFAAVTGLLTGQTLEYGATSLQLTAPVTTTTNAYGYIWKPVKIGGGGYVTGLALHPTAGTVFCRTDVGGAYRWNGALNQWQQLVTANSMPTNVLNLAIGNPGVSRTAFYGIDGIGIAPSDSNLFFLAAAGKLLKSTNVGCSFVQTDLSVYMNANGGAAKSSGERIAVKPDDATVALFGSRTNGLWRSTNAGDNWTQIQAAQIPAGTYSDAGIPVVVFDALHPNTAYASVAGVGIYASTNAGVNWSPILTNGFWAADMQVAGGILYACGGTNGPGQFFGVRKYATSAWTTITPAYSNMNNVTADPANSNRIYTVDYACQNFYRSTNGGATWTKLAPQWFTNNIPYMPYASGMAAAIAIDPTDPSRMWYVQGAGAWRCTTLSDTNNSPVFANISDGIEETCATDVAAMPDGGLLTACWDVIGFHHANPDVFAPLHSQVGPAESDVWNSTWSIGTTPANSNFAALVISEQPGGTLPYSSYTTNGGLAFTKFGSLTNGTHPNDLAFGEVAVSATDPDNMVWHPRDGTSKLYGTTNRGLTWTAATASGIASTWDNYYMDSVRHLAADGAIGGKFYYYGFTNGWVYASTDQGASFTQVGGLPSWGYWSQLKSVPGQSNNLFYVTGYDAYGAIYKSTDGGTTWSANYALYPVWAIGFGKAQTSGGYPTIFVYGYDVSGGRGWGVFRSTNAGASWTKCADCPLGIFNKVTIVNGDMNVFGKVFIGWSGNGFAYGYAP